jgi:hypothetical protein
MNKLQEMKNPPVFLLALFFLIICCPFAISQSQQDAYNTAKAFAIIVSKKWECTNELKRWADPSYSAVFDKGRGPMEKLFKACSEKLGKFKSIRAIKLVGNDSHYVAYFVDINCEKAPARIKIVMDPVGKTWKVYSFNIDSIALRSAFEPDKQTITRLQNYVDSVIPKLGSDWNFIKYKAEADPGMFLKTNAATVQQEFAECTSGVGPITKYQYSKLINSGIESGFPNATYQAHFITKNGEFMATITVIDKKPKCVITYFNVGKKIGRLPGYP